MRTLKQVLSEAAKPLNLHDDLVKNHGFTHKKFLMKGWQPKDAKGDDHYHADEEITPKYVHGVLTKHGYTHLTKSKADSRVSLPAHTHYEKEQHGSRHSIHVYHSGGEVSHIETKVHAVRD